MAAIESTTTSTHRLSSVKGVHLFKVAGHSLIKGTSISVHSKPFRVGGHDGDVQYYPCGMTSNEEATEEARNMAQHLLVAADRYGRERIKLICESKLSKILDVETVGSTLEYAERHSCQQLKDC